MRLAKEADRPAIEAFCANHPEKLMFPWSNLIRYGMGGEHLRSMTFWVNDGPVTDLFGISREGMVMAYCPNMARAVKPLTAGRSVLGLLGVTESIAPIRAALGLGPAGLDCSEPHFDLALSDLLIPPHDGLTLRSLQSTPRETLVEWRAAFSVDALAMPGADAAAKAQTDIDRYIADDSHRVLYDGDTPVALTGFNATAPGIVQVGGVYTPPALRNRGFGRLAVALHLDEARKAGTTHATLFAANAAAARAYRGIGFEEIGRFSIVIYEEAQDV